MKILMGLLIILSVGIVQADDITLSVCRDASGLFHFSFEGDVLGWWFNNATSFDLDARTTPNEGAEFVVRYDPGITESIFATEDAPLCTDQSQDWKPDAPSIPIEQYSDCAFIEIQDVYGHWSRVQSGGADVLLHYGEALIGSIGQSIDPADYRAVETECF